MSVIEAQLPLTEPDTTNLTIRNAGPVKFADFHDLPTSGIIEIHGSKGLGKSTILRTINHIAASGDGKKRPPFTVHDGELSAQVEGFGVSMRLGSRQSQKGELALVAMGAVSVDELVDPGIDNPEAADRARIAAILRMTGQGADESLFHDLVGGKDNFERMMPGIGKDEDDLVKLAGKVKRSLEAEARKSEASADLERGKALGAHEAAAGIDTNLPCDEKELGDALEKAVAAKSAIDTRVSEANASAAKVDAARKSLEEAKVKNSGLPTFDEAQERERDALKAHESADELVGRLETQLAEAKVKAETARTEWLNSAQARSSAESRQNAIRGWERDINSLAIEMPGEESIAESSKAVETAREAANTGVRVRDAKKHLAREESHKLAAKLHAENADQLRNAVRGIDGVLSGAVSRLGGALQVEGDRLYTTTKRGKTYFAELSDGERYEIGIDMLINQKPDGEERNGIGTIQQRAWGEIQPATKKRLADYARERGVLIWTAVVTDDETLSAVAL